MVSFNKNLLDKGECTHGRGGRAFETYHCGIEQRLHTLTLSLNFHS